MPSGVYSGNLVNLIGKKFGRLTVIKRVYPNTKQKQARWLCICECGTEKIIQGSDLRNGRTKSCGCLRRGRLESGVSNMRHIIRNYRYQAKKRGYNWELTEGQFKEITQQNCHYCDAEPSGKSNHITLYGEYIYNGLDRIDNNKGYIIDNVVPCCKICNKAKNNLTLQEFKDWIKRIYIKLIE